MIPICGYCNGCKKPTSITRPICGYYNGCKRLATIMKLMWGIAYLKWPYENYNKDVGIAQCSF